MSSRTRLEVVSGALGGGSIKKRRHADFFPRIDRTERSAWAVLGRMTQKSGLFKGQQKKAAAANRHGKGLHIRKGKQFKAPKQKTQEAEADKEVRKFIDSANERKAATQAAKAGARLRVVKEPRVEDAKPSKKKSVLG